MIKNTKVTLKDNSYTLLESLGAGGQGSIWKVRRDSDNTEWVMKSVLTVVNKTGREEKVGTKHIQSNKHRLQNEIDFLVSLKNAEQHYIVPCIDSGFIEDDTYGSLPAWIMPFYPHILEHKMPPYPPSAEIPSVLDCLKWIKQIATALQATHAFKTDDSTFIHRDVKPANMMLTDDNDIRLIDFGIARETLQNQDTSTRSFSPKAQAPEQVLVSRYDAKKAFYAIGSYSDIYALGIVIYRLLTGIDETEAQLKLTNEVIQKDHKISISTGGTGKLGEIGGLTSSEYSELVTEVQGKLEDESFDGFSTQISVSHDGLPDHSTIAESFADFVRLLLHADQKKRPSATQVIRWVNTLEQALSPELSRIKVHLDSNRLDQGSAISLTVETNGKGLPASGEWITLSLDGKRIKKNFDAIPAEHQQYGFLSKPQQHWTIKLPPTPETGKQLIRVTATVNEKSVSDEVEIHIENSADDLWNAGKHQQALTIKLKDEWLDELEQQCETLEQASDYFGLLKSLRKSHPDKIAALHVRVQWLQDEFGKNKQKKSNKKSFDFKHIKKRLINVIVIALLGITIGAAAYWLPQLYNPHTEQLIQWQNDLNSDIRNKQLPAWRNLMRLKSTEESANAEDILQSFEQETNALFDSNSAEKRKQAIPRLQLMADSGIKSAKERLGLAYQEGSGVEQNWEKAWDLHKQSGTSGESFKTSIEESADSILHNKNSTRAERERAYKIAEKAARTEPAGDPAQRWMEYRYRTGDGVTIDIEQADWWKRRYEGKENSKTYLGEDTQ